MRARGRQHALRGGGRCIGLPARSDAARASSTAQRQVHRHRARLHPRALVPLRVGLRRPLVRARGALPLLGLGGRALECRGDAHAAARWQRAAGRGRRARLERRHPLRRARAACGHHRLQSDRPRTGQGVLGASPLLQCHGVGCLVTARVAQHASRTCRRTGRTILRRLAHERVGRHLQHDVAAAACAAQRSRERQWAAHPMLRGERCRR